MGLKKWSGALLVVAGGFFAREFLVWAYGKALDAAEAGVRSGLSFATVSWQDAVAVALVSVGLALLVWPKTRHDSPNVNDKSEAHLYSRAVGIIDRIRWQRRAKWFQRDQIEPLPDVARAGVSLLLLFSKAGFTVPNFETTSAERVACGLEFYFSALVSLLLDGHIQEAKSASREVSEQAKAAADSLQLNEWVIDTV